jgi:carboxymethylenebutenolidase
MPETLTLSIPDGRTTTATLHLPAKLPAPAVIVVHEWWGVNADIQEHAARFAAEGFVAVVPDLYFGESTSDAGRAMELSSAMKTATSMQIVEAAVKALAGDGRCTGKVGITGFCLGGGQALAAACTVPGIAAAVPFYGSPLDAFVRFSKDTPPIQGHYAKSDPFVDPERVRRIHASAEAAGARYELHFYDGGHAFLRRSEPSTYHAPSAELAWPRAVDFLRRELR